jgi:hypothetical protein
MEKQKEFFDLESLDQETVDNFFKEFFSYIYKKKIVQGNPLFLETFNKKLKNYFGFSFENKTELNMFYFKIFQKSSFFQNLEKKQTKKLDLKKISPLIMGIMINTKENISQIINNLI